MIIITLDQHGLPMADAYVEGFVAQTIKSALALVKNRPGEDFSIHVSQMLVIDCLRAVLHDMPEEKRPEVRWIFYGQVVTFDKNLKSDNAWQDERACVAERALFKLV